MNTHRRLVSLVTIALVVALVASCSDKATNPTNNPGTTVLNSGDIPNGGSFNFTFTTAGTYNYHCVHHTMSGSVIVSSGPAAETVTIGASSYSPTPVTVGVGATVTWNNSGGVPHTVTSD